MTSVTLHRWLTACDFAIVLLTMCAGLVPIFTSIACSDRLHRGRRSWVEFRSLHACWHANSTALRPLHTSTAPSSSLVTFHLSSTLFLSFGRLDRSRCVPHFHTAPLPKVLCRVLYFFRHLLWLLFLPPTQTFSSLARRL